MRKDCSGVVAVLPVFCQRAGLCENGSGSSIFLADVNESISRGVSIIAVPGGKAVRLGVRWIRVLAGMTGEQHHLYALPHPSRRMGVAVLPGANTFSHCRWARCYDRVYWCVWMISGMVVKETNMASILITYYTRSGNTKAMAEAIAEGVRSEGAEPAVKPVQEVAIEDLLSYQGFIVGSPVYYGLPAAPIKELFDESVTLHGRLAGRVGAAFASSANIGGGNESTCTAILEMMLVHGMIVVGSAQGDHYGPCSIASPDTRVVSQCKAHGARVAKLAQVLGGADLK